MMKEEKARYLFYNDEGKILVLVNITPRFAKIFLPGKFTNYLGSLEFKKKMDELKDKLIHLYTLNFTYNRFQAVNGKLKPVTVEETKTFYSYYVDRRELFYEIYNYFREYDLECELLTVDEIMALDECSFCTDHGMKEATNILSKKLAYQIY